ncbi:MAG: hypothetical protein JO279_19190 [Verrucomicrobia bacterium]|nr:hypothetical protein [Verrucomicrobiota bacterium]
MNLSNRMLMAAAICCALCILLSSIAIGANEIAFSHIDPDNLLGLCQEIYYTIASWAFLLYDLLHIFVIIIFALVLAQTFSWEAWMGGGASVISSLADISSLSVNLFLLTATLRAIAEGKATGLVTPEAGYDVICSTLDFAQASFGLVGTLFLATAAIKASGQAKVAGWFLLVGLPISFLQIGEVGMHAPWTAVLDRWVTPIDEIIQQIVIGLALCAILNRSLKARDRKGEEVVAGAARAASVH